MQSRYGELLVAVRDGEERVRFLGYDPANIKVVAYTAAALFASIAGALFAPIVGFISPAPGRRRAVHRVPDRRRDRRPHHAARSGAGRHRRGLGADACLRTLSVGWIYVQGLLFIVVVGFLPGGLAASGLLPAGAAAGPAPRPDPLGPNPSPHVEPRCGCHR